MQGLINSSMPLCGWHDFARSDTRICVGSLHVSRLIDWPELERIHGQTCPEELACP